MKATRPDTSDRIYVPLAEYKDPDPGITSLPDPPRGIKQTLASLPMLHTSPVKEPILAKQEASHVPQSGIVEVNMQENVSQLLPEKVPVRELKQEGQPEVPQVITVAEMVPENLSTTVATGLLRGVEGQVHIQNRIPVELSQDTVIQTVPLGGQVNRTQAYMTMLQAVGHASQAATDTVTRNAQVVQQLQESSESSQPTLHTLAAAAMMPQGLHPAAAALGVYHSAMSSMQQQDNTAAIQQQQPQQQGTPQNPLQAAGTFFPSPPQIQQVQYITKFETPTTSQTPQPYEPNNQGQQYV